MSETPELLQALGDRRVGFIGCGAMAQALCLETTESAVMGDIARRPEIMA